jgi:hypothetical protein
MLNIKEYDHEYRSITIQSQQVTSNACGDLRYEFILVSLSERHRSFKKRKSDLPHKRSRAVFGPT